MRTHTVCDYTKSVATCGYTIETRVETPMQTNAKIWRLQASTTSNAYYQKMTTDKLIKLATSILLIVSEPEIT